MKAFTVARYGPDALQMSDVPSPSVGARDVLVDVRAASINPLDKMVRNGEFKQLLKYKPPFVLGHDVAGVVTQVGADVRDFKVGDEVYSRPRDLRIGTFAEFIAIDVDDVALKPSSLSFEEAGAVPLVALASWQALADVAQVNPARRFSSMQEPAGSVPRSSRSPSTSAPTSPPPPTPRTRTRSARSVPTKSSTSPSRISPTYSSGYDVVLDSLGGPNLEKSLTVLKPGGLAISVAGPPEPTFAKQLGQPMLAPVMAVLSRKVRKQTRKLGVRYSFLFMHASGAQLKTIAGLYDDGTLRPVLDRTFEFDQTLQAMAYVEQGKANGKIVVTR